MSETYEMSLSAMIERLQEQAGEIAELTAMVAERDQQLAAKDAELERVRIALIAAGKLIAWHHFGEIRAYAAHTKDAVRKPHEVDAMIKATLASPAAGAVTSIQWQSEDAEPTEKGWYAVQRADGSLCIRAWGNGLWWIPLRDGWFSGLPAGFKWFGPLEPIDWDTPRSKAELQAQTAPATEPEYSVQWTPVTTRLPNWTDDYSARVLVYSETHDWAGDRMLIVHPRKLYPDADGEVCFDMECVTHWAELPEQPAPVAQSCNHDWTSTTHDGLGRLICRNCLAEQSQEGDL